MEETPKYWAVKADRDHPKWKDFSDKCLQINEYIEGDFWEYYGCFGYSNIVEQKSILGAKVIEGTYPIYHPTLITIDQACEILGIK